MSAHAAAETTVHIPVIRVDPDDACGPWQLPPVLELPVEYLHLVKEKGLPEAPVESEEEAA